VIFMIIHEQCTVSGLLVSRESFFSPRDSIMLFVFVEGHMDETLNINGIPDIHTE